MTQPDSSVPAARVLIVEDEILISEELSERLTRLGLEVVGTADTADEGIRLALLQRPDLILMDIRLKGPKDGIQAAEQIKASLGVPVIYITAYSDRVTLDRAKCSLPDGYILKPFHERELQVAIEGALYRHSVQRKKSTPAEARF